jgi:predicted TIM-barrel fold metal-dependent hydrolase
VLRGAVVVDAVVHPYDLSAENQLPENLMQLRAVYTSHVVCTGPHHAYRLSEEEFLVDFDGEALSHALFAESPVDLAVIHSLPNLGFTKGWVTSPERMAELRDRHPNRYLLYATVDSPVADTAISQLERQVQTLGVDGLKLYPAFFYEGSGKCWRMDDTDYATPLLEAARDMGIRNVAVHKAIPVPPAPEACFRVEDLDGALERFPTLNFHIVHAGVTFLAQTAELMVRHPNLYANLESSFSYLIRKPAVFAEVLATLLVAGGPERILYGSGANLMHPRPLLEAFADYEIPADVADRLGCPPLSDEIRRKIVGENALRLHGLNAAAVRDRVADDTFETEKRQGLAPPWSLLRCGAGDGR